MECTSVLTNTAAVSYSTSQQYYTNCANGNTIAASRQLAMQHITN